MKFFSLILVNLVIASICSAQENVSFGQVSVTPNTVSIQTKDLEPCPLPDGTPSSDFPLAAPSADITGIRIQNDLDHPLKLIFISVQTDHDVLAISTENDVLGMFHTDIVPAHSSVTSVCGYRVGNVDLGTAGSIEIPARVDVLAVANDSQGIQNNYEDKASVTLKWDGSARESFHP